MVICCDESYTPEIQGSLHATNVGKQSVHDMQNKVFARIWHFNFENTKNNNK